MFKGRTLRSFGNIDTTEVMFYKGNEQIPTDGIILNHIGSRMFNIMDRKDESLHRRHLDQIHISKSQDETKNLNNTEAQSESTNKEDEESEPRRSERERKRPNYLRDFET